MISKLQRRTLIPAQIIGYALTLFIGTAIIMISVQFYLDVRPLLENQTDVFSKNAAVVSKQVGIVSAKNDPYNVTRESVYFTDEEIMELEEQPFVEEVARFKNARFGIYAEMSVNGEGFGTDLFFESVPDEYLDARPENWYWDGTEDEIPIIIPEDYLNLYNFGYAQSLGKPLLSKWAVISASRLKITISGRSQALYGRIVGFSNKINSILVPESFLDAANEKYGSPEPAVTSRLLVEFSDPTDERILGFFNANNYSINEDKLEFSKLVFIFKSSLAFVLFIALIIVVLSVAFILLSLNLIFEKNKETILNLYHIGYSNEQIARYYRIAVSAVSLFSLLGAVSAGLILRNYYMKRVVVNFMIKENTNWIIPAGLAAGLLLLLMYNVLVIRSIRRINNPANK